ncbi:MAG: laccase domain-containing protein, partial [Peptococcaceae bacterium]|nr:laccase domain-containing protein [Peptococcaceae bacterium]
NQLQLEEIGLLRNNIEVSEFCTYENVDRFYSHRAEHGITGRNAALLMLK